MKDGASSGASMGARRSQWGWAITTKRGVEGVRVNNNIVCRVSRFPTRMPKSLEPMEHMELANEGCLPMWAHDPQYSEPILANYRRACPQNRYPTAIGRALTLKNTSFMQNQQCVGSINAFSEKAKIFLDLSAYLDQDGIIPNTRF